MSSPLPSNLNPRQASLYPSLSKDPKVAALQKLNKQILQIGRTDPEKASFLSRQVLLCTWTHSALKKLQTLGLNILGITAHPGLLGGGKERWIKGPQMTLSGTNHKIEVFNIPQGCKYKDWREDRWDISPRNASCSVRYVTANSQAEIDELRTFKNSNDLEAAIQAKGLDVFEVGASGKAGKSTQRKQQGAHAEKHAHAALIITGTTVGSCCGGGRIDVSISISIEENLSASSSFPPESYKPTHQEPHPFFPSTTSSTHKQQYQEETEQKFPEEKANHPNRPNRSSYIPLTEMTSRQRASTVNLNIPIEKACPLIKRKLNDPQSQLTVEQSLDLLTTCVRYGNEYAKKIIGKDAVIVIGNTGAGKSTFVNYLSGCTMVLKSPKQLGFKGIKKLVVVKPPKEGGNLGEVMPIGHTKKSKTFMPQIETDRTHNITYCDCPGFLDNRGAEINIANAVNIKTALTNAHSVRVIILINYHSLVADRGRGLSDMLTICSNLFGNVKNLKRFQKSLLLGVTQVPTDMNLEDLKEWITEDTPDIMQTLSQRLFLSDPLDRPLEGGWQKEECLRQIGALTPIKDPDRIFQTVLTDTDEKTLIRIVEKMSTEIQKHLDKNNLPKASERLRHLKRLTVINHSAIERLLYQNKLKLIAHFQKIIDAFKTHCHFDNFSAANQLLQELQAIQKHFPEENNIDMKKLHRYRQTSEERYQERQQKEKKAAEDLRAAQGQIQQLLELLESQKQETRQQMQEQEQRFNTMLQEMKASMQETVTSYDQMKAAIQKEMEDKIRQKDQEIQIAKTLGTEEKRKVEEERQKLSQEYAQKIRQAQQEKDTFLANQKAEQQQREQELAEQQAKLQQKLEAIEAQKAQTTAQLKKTARPKIAFGKEEWAHYFGDIGQEPPIPQALLKTLQTQCPYWPDKTVAETHLLTLIPKTVNGKPFTLNLLQELIQSPQGGGHATQYSHYGSDTKKEHGNHSPRQSYWSLVTRDVIPNSRSKNYSEQKALLKGPYETPQALELATAILMHHAGTGERLYPDKPSTYTRCQEKVCGNKYRVFVGGFGSSGLHVNYCDGDSYRSGIFGLGGSRKFI